MDSGWDTGSDPAIAELMEVLASLGGSMESKIGSTERAFYVYQYPWGSWVGERSGVLEIPIGLSETIGVLRRAASGRDS